jgi:hypothetical protein
VRWFGKKIHSMTKGTSKGDKDDKGKAAAAQAKDKGKKAEEAPPPPHRKLNEKRLADKAYLSKNIEKAKLLRRLKVCIVKGRKGELVLIFGCRNCLHTWLRGSKIQRRLKGRRKKRNQVLITSLCNLFNPTLLNMLTKK